MSAVIDPTNPYEIRKQQRAQQRDRMLTITNPEPFFDFVNERHAIYLRRAAGQPPPWTADPELLKYKFCNVFRELDTVTIWIRENIREPYADHPDLWLMLALARYINHPESLAEVIHPELWPEGNPQLEAITAILEARRKAGLQTETGAYMIRAESDRTAPWYSWSKQRYIVEIVVGGLWKHRAEVVPRLKNTGAAPAVKDEWYLRWPTPPKGPVSLAGATTALQEHYGWGAFMSYEVATDLRHCPGWLDQAPDIMTWANAGPGAHRGLNRLCGRPLKAKSPDAVREMQELRTLATLYLASHVPTLEMRDVEHSLCETDKWLRAKEGGRPRSLFKPRM